QTCALPISASVAASEKDFSMRSSVWLTCSTDCLTSDCSPLSSVMLVCRAITASVAIPRRSTGRSFSCSPPTGSPPGLVLGGHAAPDDRQVRGEAREERGHERRGSGEGERCRVCGGLCEQRRRHTPCGDRRGVCLGGGAHEATLGGEHHVGGDDLLAHVGVRRVRGGGWRCGRARPGPPPR